jgi:hypothetical protein
VIISFEVRRVSFLRRRSLQRAEAKRLDRSNEDRSARKLAFVKGDQIDANTSCMLADICRLL